MSTGELAGSSSTAVCGKRCSIQSHDGLVAPGRRIDAGRIDAASKEIADIRSGGRLLEEGGRDRVRIERCTAK